jgi:hypothetical protein
MPRRSLWAAGDVSTCNAVDSRRLVRLHADVMKAITAAAGLGCILLVLGGSLAVAASKIPPSDLAGRERERFVDPPIARFFQPGFPTAEPLIHYKCRKGSARKHRRSKRMRIC